MVDQISRRAFLAASGAGVLHTAASAAGLKLGAAPFRIGALLVDGIANPMGVHNGRNRLSWQLLAPDNQARQSAYRIGVASSEARARAGNFDLWDSGKVESSRCFDIAYAGKSLISRQRAWWVVSCWGEAGAVATSDVTWWEMGLLDPKDWAGRWIAAEDLAARADRTAGFYWMTAPGGSRPTSRSFRLAFDLPSAARAALMVAASSRPEVWLDGQALPVPPHNVNAWGPPQPAEIPLAAPLAAGRHVVTVYVPGIPDLKAALLLRATLADGRTVYIDDRHADTMAGKAADPAAPPMAGDGWAAAAVVMDPPAPLPAGGAWLLRRPFGVQGAVAAARLYVTALGVYEAELNGARLGDALLTPEFTDYRKRVLYQVHDVTAQLRPGANVLGGIVGEGWYGSNVAPSGRYSYGPAPLRFLAQLEIRYADGRTQLVSGDDQWLVARAPITMSGIYDGEEYDARLEQPGWSAPGFTAAAPRWEHAEFAPDALPTCRLVGAVVPPIRRTARLAPAKITSLAADRQVVDFGQNYAGWVRLRVRGKAGQQVTLRFAELVNADGSADQSNLRGARATDRYTLRGDPAGESFEPRFTYHGFRYVEVESLNARLRATDIEGIVIRSSVTETGELSLDQQVPQRMWQNALWSQRSNFIGIPTDCPQRDERLGWMGDAHVFWDAAAYNMDVAAFTTRFMGDVEDAQQPEGAYPDFAPSAASSYTARRGSSPGWADAGVILPWTVWWRYGDTGIVDTHWDSMVRFMDSIRRGNPDLIWSRERGSDYADWLALDAKRPGDPTTPKDLVGTAMWKAAADAMAQMAVATGRSAEADAYRALADGLTQAFIRAFVKPDGTVGNGSQTGYIQALQFGLLPSAMRPAAARNLVADIHRRGTLLSTGFLGTPYSLDVLADAGESKLVYDLLLRTGYPSWGYMIAKNATTIWERWNGDAGDRSMNSFNHYALGAVAGFLFRRIAGIDATAPGFARFRFDPVYDDRLTTGAARYQSRSGPIATRWQRNAQHGFRLELQVPPNTEASVVLPARSLADVRNGSRALSPSRSIRLQTGGSDDKLGLIVAPGKYDFRIGRLS
jgi:alpha-L-rhamnosidase